MDTITGTQQASDTLTGEVARAAYATWLHNGHDVIAALAHASRHAHDPAVRHTAGEAHDEALKTPIVWAAFTADFDARLAAELAATA